MFFTMLRLLVIVSAATLIPSIGHANPIRETAENNFLDLVDGEGNVLVQGQGAADVNRKARSQGLTFQPLGIGLRKVIASLSLHREIAMVSSSVELFHKRQPLSP